MKELFGFGISQEDPLTELKVLDLQTGDHILSVASGGEVPLSLMSLVPDIHMTAVDISVEQIRLCRLKMLVATTLAFPLNGEFLGYAKIEERKRLDIYHNQLRSLISEDDRQFWDQNLKVIKKGVINAGKFELFIRKLRFVVNLLLGKRNILKLINSNTHEAQQEIFEQHIATRKSLQYLFKIAFHPSIYKNRGLQEQALIHADGSTGERFYAKFRQFCTVGFAGDNYFLSYFLLGNCVNPRSYPPYLLPQNQACLQENLSRFELRLGAFQDMLKEKSAGTFNKIHLSNLGDWLEEPDFQLLMDDVVTHCGPGTKICSRHLHKNYFASGQYTEFEVNRELSVMVEQQDRFPFYGITSVVLKKI